ncbi:MAG: kinase [Clostridia bacterium]|nr:kinase [Clostridia bacterium]
MVISRTPFRMSFFGGGTDYREYFEKYGGSVISATFDKYCFVTVKDFPPFFPVRNQLTYSKIERFNEPEELSHPLVREVYHFLHEQQLQINYDSDLPARSGIGSSSSFAVGLLNSIHAHRGKTTNPYTLATEAITVERDLCREYGGIQDQIAAAYGGFNRIDFDKTGFYVKPLNIRSDRLEQLNGRLMLFFSGLSRVAGEISREQADNLGKNITTLSNMKFLTDEAEKILLSDESLDHFGELLDLTWQLKRKLAANIANDEVERMYETAKRCGAIGGKLLGAGGGGFMLFYVPEDRQAALREALKDYMYVPFRFENEGSRIIYNQK